MRKLIHFLVKKLNILLGYRIMKPCKQCDGPFKPKRKEQKFCCPKCAVAYNRKHKFDFGKWAFW